MGIYFRDSSTDVVGLVVVISNNIKDKEAALSASQFFAIFWAPAKVHLHTNYS